MYIFFDVRSPPLALGNLLLEVGAGGYELQSSQRPYVTGHRGQCASTRRAWRKQRPNTVAAGGHGTLSRVFGLQGPRVQGPRESEHSGRNMNDEKETR